MIPNEVLLEILLLTLVGAFVGMFAAMVITAYLHSEMFEGKWTLLMIIWTTGLAYAVPIIYVWTMRSSYFQELISDYPVSFLTIGFATVYWPLFMWLTHELEKRGHLHRAALGLRRLLGKEEDTDDTE